MAPAEYATTADTTPTTVWYSNDSTDTVTYTTYYSAGYTVTSTERMYNAERLQLAEKLERRRQLAESQMPVLLLGRRDVKVQSGRQRPSRVFKIIQPKSRVHHKPMWNRRFNKK